MDKTMSEPLPIRLWAATDEMVAYDGGDVLRSDPFLTHSLTPPTDRVWPYRFLVTIKLYSQKPVLVDGEWIEGEHGGFLGQWRFWRQGEATEKRLNDDRRRRQMELIAPLRPPRGQCWPVELYPEERQPMSRAAEGLQELDKRIADARQAECDAKGSPYGLITEEAGSELKEDTTDDVSTDGAGA